MKRLIAFLLTGLLALMIIGCQSDTTNPAAAPGASNNSGGSLKMVVLPPSISNLAASQTTIWPPNKKMVTVTFTGSISYGGSGIYTLTDEYGKISYTGTVTGNFSVPLQLEAWRRGNDKNGRTYTFTVTAVTASASVTVVVPHDQGDDEEEDDGD